jgi:phosphoribosylformylglycinamidine synthase I
VLLESGLLPGAMLRNQSLRFICKQVYLRCENTDTPFTNRLQAGQVLKIPIAHTDGNYYSYRGEVEDLARNGQVVFRYSTASGELTDAANPNGSIDNVAGICNRRGNVFGMMPHPERASELLLASEDGLGIFQSIAAFCRSGVKV